MTIALGFEILLAVLLLLTVIYCWRLDRRLSALHTGTDGMREAVRELVEATQKAQNCILGLSQTSATSAAELDQRMQSARKLAADLQRLERQGRTRLAGAPLAAMKHHSGLMDRLRETHS